MTLKLPAELAESVEAVSRSSGVSIEQLVTEALRAHFPPIDSTLQADFTFWEEASAHSMGTVDKLLDDNT